MDWNLIIAVVALIVSLGGFIAFIFTVGSWKATVDTLLDKLRVDINKAFESLEGGSDLNGMIEKIVSTAINQLRIELNIIIARAHERIDESIVNEQSRKKEQHQVESRLELMIAGLQSQRQDWEVLRNDVRALLRSEATTTNEITNVRERLYQLEQKYAVWSEKVINLRSDVAHITLDRKK